MAVASQNSFNTSPPQERLPSEVPTENTGGVIHSIQALRFVAAVMVVLAHSVDLAGSPGFGKSVLFAGNLENFGAAGVDIFFVISGFIITRSSLNCRQSGITFLRNRIIRVVPLYYLMSLPWVWFAVKHADLDWSDVPATFLFFPAAGSTVVFPALFIGWTLCFEMLFYLSFTLILMAKSRLAVVALLVIYVAMWALRVTTALPISQYLGNPIAIEFLFGVVIALAGRLKPQPVPFLCLGLATVWFVATIVIGFGRIDAAEFTLNGTLSLQRVFIWGIPSALLVLGASNWRARAQQPLGMMFSYLGDASYSIYLTHPIVFRALQRATDFYQPNADVVIILAAALAIASGVIVHEWIEKPVTRSFRARFGRSMKLPAGGEAQS